MRIIINADDCGYSTIVNEHIGRAISLRKITSTTVMANMQDLKGAKTLYDNFKDNISFGWHINLTEGSPLLYSQRLLDYGFYIEKEGEIVMNGKDFKNKLLTQAIRSEIEKELTAQYQVLRDNGIIPSHIDGHHHIHTSLWAMVILPSLLKKMKVECIRRIYNNMSNLPSLAARDLWAIYYKFHKMRMTEMFCSFSEYANNKIKKCELIELECHPGHPKYQEEEKLLLETNFDEQSNVELVNYYII